MNVIHIILMAPYIQTNNEEQYLSNNDITYYVITCNSAFEYNNDVTYYVITCKPAFHWVYAEEQWYVIISGHRTHK